MFRTNNYTTLLLVLIVILLIAAVAVALYYALDLDWFKTDVGIYTEVNPYGEQAQNKPTVIKETSLDISKRTYELYAKTNELLFTVHKDGSVGVTMLSNDKYNLIYSYASLINKEVKTSLTNIVRAIKVEASETSDAHEYVLLIDKDGNVYKFVETELMTNGKYAFMKIEGLSKIVDIMQIANTDLTENKNGINAIAIDEAGNETLITNYLIK